MRNVWKCCRLGAAAILVLAVACGCTTNTPAPTAMPTIAAAVSPSPIAATAAPPQASATAGDLTITVDGKVLAEKGIRQNTATWLPLEAVATALGYDVQRGQSGGTVSELTFARAGAANPTKVTYQTGENGIANASIAKNGASLTFTDPLRMQGGTLYAAEKVFADALDAKVTLDEAAGTAMVTRMAAATPAATTAATATATTAP